MENPVAKARTRVCSVDRCPEIHDGPGAKCPTHRQEALQRHWEDTAHYSTPGHRRFRRIVLERDPICTDPEGCNQPSTVADHYPRDRKELEALHLNPNDPQFGRGLCKRHHDRHTALTQPGGWNARD
jgi:5-methylcytosine-specific restriction enzyme A